MMTIHQHIEGLPTQAAKDEITALLATITWGDTAFRVSQICYRFSVLRNLPAYNFREALEAYRDSLKQS